MTSTLCWSTDGVDMDADEAAIPRQTVDPRRLAVILRRLERGDYDRADIVERIALSVAAALR